ncbi:MAG: indole-3-glycerol phosphate synthase TrpC [Bryobacteraceae bacterium]|nr:indole-3-glycerol phosphate synthase TrpC [Bryobacteraceae bacterium]
MVGNVPDILSRIVERKRADLDRLIPQRLELERRAEECAASRRDFRKALESRAPAVIAEIKKASPSRGVLAQDFDPVRLGRAYEAGGAAALSVLTDAEFFQGSLADLETARGAATLPALRKDFTIHELHVIEAAAHGADAILLIAAILTRSEIRRFRELAGEFGMAALVEAHDAGEVREALASGAGIVGVNNRNLHTFEVRLDTSLRLAREIPPDILKVSESGIRSRDDISRLRDGGFQAFLVGESLMQSSDPAAALRALTS